MQGYLFLCLPSRSFTTQEDIYEKRSKDGGGELDWKFMTEESSEDKDNLHRHTLPWSSKCEDRLLFCVHVGFT